MNPSFGAWEQVEKLVWRDVLIIVAILLLTRLLVLAMQRQLRRAAEKAKPHRRLIILRFVPIARLLFRAAAILIISAASGGANVSQHSRPVRRPRPGAGLHAERLWEQFCSRARNGTGKHLPARRLD